MIKIESIRKWISYGYNGNGQILIPRVEMTNNREDRYKVRGGEIVTE